MSSEIDIYYTARILMEKHGAEAEIFAGMRADACAEAGDLDGKATWLRVIRAIGALRDTAPPSDSVQIQ